VKITFDEKYTNEYIVNQLNNRIEKALNLMKSNVDIQGSDHKSWLIDQIARTLTGKQYPDFIKFVNPAEDDFEDYWDKGTPP
jgi:hypothetical protein